MYEIGDKVIINHRERPAKDYYLNFADSMTTYEHYVATITNKIFTPCTSVIKDDNYTYKLDIDEGIYKWRSSMFSPYKEEITFSSKKKHYELKFSL